MASEMDGSLSKRTIVSVIRGVVTRRNVVMLVAGVLAGYSLSVLGKDAVVVPLVGSVPGTLVGVVGVAVALAVYQQGSCCDDCGDKECGCAGECGDSCSYEP